MWYAVVECWDMCCSVAWCEDLKHSLPLMFGVCPGKEGLKDGRCCGTDLMHHHAVGAADLLNPSPHTNVHCVTLTHRLVTKAIKGWKSSP